MGEEFGDGVLEFEDELLADGERVDGRFHEIGEVERSGYVLSFTDHHCEGHVCEARGVGWI